jgi:hypothetical protein
MSARCSDDPLCFIWQLDWYCATWLCACGTCRECQIKRAARPLSRCPAHIASMRVRLTLRAGTVRYRLQTCTSRIATFAPLLSKAESTLALRLTRTESYKSDNWCCDNSYYNVAGAAATHNTIYTPVHRSFCKQSHNAGVWGMTRSGKTALYAPGSTCARP